MGKKLGEESMKKVINIFIILVISIIILPLSAQAANIVTLNVKNNNGTLTVSGTTESDVHAVAVLIYSSNDLVYMETCSNDESYSCKLNKQFANGTYTVKVADYDGGDYITKEITIVDSNVDNPDTGDNILSSIILSSVSLISLISISLYLNKNKRFN